MHPSKRMACAKACFSHCWKAHVRQTCCGSVFIIFEMDLITVCLPLNYIFANHCLDIIIFLSSDIPQNLEHVYDIHGAVTCQTGIASLNSSMPHPLLQFLHQQLSWRGGCSPCFQFPVLLLTWYEILWYQYLCSLRHK